MKIRNAADSAPSASPLPASTESRGSHHRPREGTWPDDGARPTGKGSAMWGKHGGHRASDLPHGEEPTPTTSGPDAGASKPAGPGKPTPPSTSTASSKPTPPSTSAASSKPAPSSASAAPSKPAASSASTGATTTATTSTYAALSMDALYKLAPAPLKAQWANMEAAAKKYGVQPQVLVAMAMVESTGGTDKKAYSNGGGMFQFTDPNTRATYGLTGKTNDDAASVEAAAHYLSDTLKDTGNNLGAALRTYNGSIGQGGASDYQARIQAFMAGKGF